MGDQFLEILIFALVALFLVYRLWSVLGRRTGTERPPQLPPAVGRVAPPPAGNVVSLPSRAPAPLPPQDPVRAGLAEIAAADPSFRPEPFLDGARHAFELIVKAYAEGDTATLRPLVSDEVYDSFAEAIRQRLAQRETVNTQVVRLAEPEITQARLEGRTAVVTVRFVSGQTSVTRSADGKLIEGDPERAVEHTDLWTFARNTRSSNPNWSLVATGAPE